MIATQVLQGGSAEYQADRNHENHLGRLQNRKGGGQAWENQHTQTGEEAALSVSLSKGACTQK